MLTERDDIKIFILFLLNKVGYAISYDELHDMAVQDGYITGFDYIEACDELLRNGNMVLTEENGERIVSITDKGIHIAETLHGRLLSSVREKAVKSAMRLLSFKKSGTKMTCEGAELSRGKYEFRCKINDNSGDVMELKIRVDSRKQLDAMVYNFENRPEFMYKGILALLTGEADYLLN